MHSFKLSIASLRLAPRAFRLRTSWWGRPTVSPGASGVIFGVSKCALAAAVALFPGAVGSA